MSFTVTQLNALEAAIASGVLEVEYNGKRTRYQNMTALLQARNLVRASLVASGAISDSTQTNRGPASLAVFSRE